MSFGEIIGKYREKMASSMCMKKINIPQILEETKKIYVEKKNINFIFNIPNDVTVSTFKQNEDIPTDGVVLCENIDNKCSYQNVDYIGNWTSSVLVISVLKKLGISEYTDLLGNKVMLTSTTSGQIKIVRSMKAGKCSCVHAGVRLGNVKTITGEVHINISGKSPYIRLGRDITTKGLDVECGTKGRVIIGNDVMMARSIQIWQSDGHLIFSRGSGERVNQSKNVYVGDHVWLGREVMLLGGANIPSGCVLGARSITSHYFEEENCIIAGNPGKVIRKDIEWVREESNKDYQNISDCKRK